MEDSICLFVDLQLDVKGCRDVYASFDKYVEVERLEGDNKYHAEQYGLQVDGIESGDLPGECCPHIVILLGSSPSSLVNPSFYIGEGVVILTVIVICPS